MLIFHSDYEMRKPIEQRNLLKLTILCINCPEIIKALSISCCNSESVKRELINKTRTSKVGAISKAQKEQNIFFENLEFLNFFLSENVA